MKCVSFFALTLVSFVAGEGAWEPGKEYTYQLVARTLNLFPESNQKIVGVVSRAYLSIRPQSYDILIGQITRAEYGKVNEQLIEEWNSYLDNRKLEDWPLNKPFKINLENGVIRSLSVDNSMTNYEINQLKVIVSQFQLDTNGQNQLQFKGNQLPENNIPYGFYRTMEPLVTGNCETVYDISPIPEYLIRSHPEWVPLPELNGAKEFIQIVKSRSYNNCHETSGYLLDIAGRREFNTMGMGQNELHLTENRRIVISGSLVSYTIQSSETVNKVINGRTNSQTLSDYINVTLVSVENSINIPAFRLENLMSLKNIGNLVYHYDDKNQSFDSNESDDLSYSASLDYSSSQMIVKYDNYTPAIVKPETPQKSDNFTTDISQETNVSGAHERWTNCWTAFPAASTLCKSEFGPEYEDTNTQNCGFLGLGKQALCKFTYPGCKATPCYTVFIQRSELCERTFGDEFPVTKGGFVDCSPGFYRSRCCPKNDKYKVEKAP